MNLFLCAANLFEPFVGGEKSLFRVDGAEAGGEKQSKKETMKWTRSGEHSSREFENAGSIKNLTTETKRRINRAEKSSISNNQRATEDVKRPGEKDGK